MVCLFSSTSLFCTAGTLILIMLSLFGVTCRWCFELNLATTTSCGGKKESCLVRYVCVCEGNLWLLLPWYLRLWVQQSLSHFPGNVLKRFLKERLFSSFVLWVCESWVYCITKYWSCPTALPVPPFSWVEQKSGTHAFEVQTSNFSTFEECLCAFYNILSSFN